MKYLDQLANSDYQNQSNRVTSILIQSASSIGGQDSKITMTVKVIKANPFDITWYFL